MPDKTDRDVEADEEFEEMTTAKFLHQFYKGRLDRAEQVPVFGPLVKPDMHTTTAIRGEPDLLAVLRYFECMSYTNRRSVD